MKKIRTALRRSWHWLTSMRTALALLFLLALAAIPGSLLPQRDLNESNVNDFIASNGRVAEIYDKLQLFDVFNSTWFSAIFVLLTIYLVGCNVTSSWDHYKTWKTTPTLAPLSLHRTQMHAKGETARTFEQMQAPVKPKIRN